VSTESPQEGWQEFEEAADWCIDGQIDARDDPVRSPLEDSEVGHLFGNLGDDLSRSGTCKAMSVRNPSTVPFLLETVANIPLPMIATFFPFKS
jgi:hypothetical protein